MEKDNSFETGFFLQMRVNNKSYGTRKIQNVDMHKLENAYNEVMDKIEKDSDTESETESETETKTKDVRVQLCVHNKVAISHNISPIFSVSNVDNTLRMLLEHYENYKKVFSDEYLKMFWEDPISLAV